MLKKKKATPKDSTILTEAILKEESGYLGLRCECGEPVAVGQNSVCTKHIRTN